MKHAAIGFNILNCIFSYSNLQYLRKLKVKTKNKLPKFQGYNNYKKKKKNEPTK